MKKKKDKRFMIDATTDGVIHFVENELLLRAEYLLTHNDNASKMMALYFYILAFNNLIEQLNKQQARYSKKGKTGIKVVSKRISKLILKMSALVDGDPEFQCTPAMEVLTTMPTSKSIHCINNAYDVYLCDMKPDEVFNAIDSGKNIAVDDILMRHPYPNVYLRCNTIGRHEETIGKVETFPNLDCTIWCSEKVMRIIQHRKAILNDLERGIRTQGGVESSFISFPPLMDTDTVNKRANGLTEDIINMITGSQAPKIYESTKYTYSMLIDALYGGGEARNKFKNPAGTLGEFKLVKVCATIYRTEEGASKFVDFLIDAAREGVEVDVFFELRARGDECHNTAEMIRLYSSLTPEQRKLVTIRYEHRVKVHSKMIILDYTRVGDGYPAERHLTITSTGNFNTSTSEKYHDLYYVSANETYYEAKRRFDKVYKNRVALLSISQLVRQSICEQARLGSDGRIWIMVNHLDDEDIVKMLKDCVRRGVDVKLIVRNTKGFSKSELRCRTLAGLTLEHSRIFIFGKGDRMNVYIGSTDLMHRNLHNRFESWMQIAENRSAKKVEGIFGESWFEAKSSKPKLEKKKKDKSKEKKLKKKPLEAPKCLKCKKCTADGTPDSCKADKLLHIPQPSHDKDLLDTAWDEVHNYAIKCSANATRANNIRT